MSDTPAFLDSLRPAVPDIVVPRGVTPFYLPHRPVRGRLIRLGPLADALLTRHDNPPLVRRITGEALALAAGLGRDAAHSQFLAGVDAVLHLGRDVDGTRILREVAVPQRRPDGLAEMLTAVSFPGAGQAVTGPGESALAARLAG
jgi:molecular chaperone Hsp33